MNRTVIIERANASEIEKLAPFKRVIALDGDGVVELRIQEGVLWLTLMTASYVDKSNWISYVPAESCAVEIELEEALALCRAITAARKVIQGAGQ